MASTPVTPSDGNHPADEADGLHAVLPLPGLRLGDAEQIAVERLDGAPRGSLKEALAVAPASAAPSAEPSLIERVEAACEEFAAQATFFPFGGPEPVVAPVDTPDGALHADLSEPERGASANEPPARAATQLVPPRVAIPEVQAIASAPAETWQAPLERAPPSLAVAETTPPQLANAIGAAAQLMADAGAAAEALDNLKRMLERQMPIPGPAPMPEPMSDREQARPAERAAVPPPLPSPQPQLVRDPPRSRPASPPPRSVQPALASATERARFDVRGFLAGFALSWAIGAVLYLFMTVG